VSVPAHAQAPLRGSSMPVDKYDVENRAAQDLAPSDSRESGRLSDQTRVIYG